VFSQSVLLALVEGGLSRDEAYRIVQERAMQAWETETSFRTLVESDPQVTLTSTQLDTAFDLARVLKHSHRFIDAIRPFAP
jgi:adenylosuccinate lyase